MSNAVFPSLPGLTWDIVRKPIWDTTVRTSRSGREFRFANWSYPIWQYTLKYEFLRAKPALAELQTLMGFFNARQGSFDTFLYEDPDDNAVTAQPLGLGDGTKTQFQLVRSYGGYTEPVFDPTTVTTVAVNGSSVSFSLGSDGVITTAAAPASGAAVTWTGTYRWRCRFVQDQAEFTQFMRRLWSLRTLEFRTVKR